MSVALLDVNVLVALFDPMHVNHEQAHRCFSQNKRRGFTSCPITINGCVRVLSNPVYPTVSAKSAEVAQRLGELCSTPHHQFWPDAISLTDEALFRWPMISGHQLITDVYLLALAIYNHGRLATFDRAIPLNAIHGSAPGHLAILAPAAQ